MDIFDKKGINPMLIAEMVEPYDDANSIFEVKFDGIRCIAYIDSDAVDLRNKRDYKLLPRFPELSSIYKNCSCKCILDGELIVALNGKPDFYEVQKRTLLRDPFKIRLASGKYPATFVAYDILYYKDSDITKIPLIERKQLLSNVVSENYFIAISRYIENNGIALYELAKKQNLEGVVGKTKESLYWFGKRSREWKKVKYLKYDDLIALGFIPKQNQMTTLVMGKYNDKDYMEITNYISLGVNLNKLKQNGMRIIATPFDPHIKPIDGVTWIEPMVCTVEYMPSKKEGMRQAVLKNIRSDKKLEECRTDG